MFYTVSQNNSGGYFINNEDVAEYLIIEAHNNDDYEDKLEKITDKYSEYCPCCGERWSSWNDGGTEEPKIHGETLQEFFNSPSIFNDKDVIVYYLDGRKEKLSRKRQ